ncbi:MAG: 3'-5' exonuclease domain-containing protein 2 [Betaproteobacteria bacterium]|nr:3'-5' exonuclease domain-containing protein 2 [Betaproteobacteria bacterium]
MNPSALPAQFLRDISREEMNALPIRRYEGEVCLVASPQELERAMADIRQERVLGWDTETRPAFKVGESYLPCLFQAATSHAVYLFQLTRLDFAGAISEIMASPATVKAGVSVADDLKKLKLVFPFEEAAVLDLGYAIKRHGLKQTGLRNLTGIFLGTRIPKGNRTSNWAAPRLNPAQINYAATDAWACRELYIRFRELGLL